VKPLEILIFLCDVKSDLYFEQMKRPARAPLLTKSCARLRPTPRLISDLLIDASGVSESPKTVSLPLRRDRGVSFDPADRRYPRPSRSTSKSGPKT
jgi:type I restriction enzyme, R subunit